MTIQHISGKKPHQKTKQDSARWRTLLQLMIDDKASITIDGFEFTKEWATGIIDYLDAMAVEQNKVQRALAARKRRHKSKFTLIKKT